MSAKTQNKLTGPETFKLATAISELTAEPQREPWSSWEAAESHFSAFLNRRVTRANIRSACEAVEVSPDCLVVVPTTRSPGQQVAEIAVLAGKVDELARVGAETERVLAEGLDGLTSRVDAVCEIQARDEANITTLESGREVVRHSQARHEAEIGHLRTQNVELAGRLKILESFWERLTAEDGPIAELEKAAGILDDGDTGDRNPPEVPEQPEGILAGEAA